MTILAKCAPVVPKTIEVWGRKVILEKTVGRVLMASFKMLCGDALSAAEYLKISEEFDVVILSDIPRLDLSTRNEARRFITLIDALYEARVKLIASYETNLEELFDGRPIDPIDSVMNQDRLMQDELNLSTKVSFYQYLCLGCTIFYIYWSRRSICFPTRSFPIE